METKYGIDISKHNGNIDFVQVKNTGKVDFAILRAGFGKLITQKDKCFERYYADCKANNIPVGAYWYSYATTPEEARQEAKVCLEAIKDKQFEYPIFFDLEEQKAFFTGKDNCSRMVEAFNYVLEKAGYFAGLYMSKSHAEQYVYPTVRERFAMWIAHYGVAKTTYSNSYGMWQKTDSGKIAGIAGTVDLDECYIDYPTVIKNSGLNGYTKQTVTTDTSKKAVADEISVSMVVNGKTYAGTLKRS